MKIAALQTVSTPDVDRNLDAAARLIARAAGEGAKLVVLPEYFCLMARRDGDKLAVAEAPGIGPIQAFLAAQARQYGLWLVGGTLPLRTDDQPQPMLPGLRRQEGLDGADARRLCDFKFVVVAPGHQAEVLRQHNQFGTLAGGTRDQARRGVEVAIDIRCRNRLQCGNLHRGPRST